MRALGSLRGTVDVAMSGIAWLRRNQRVTPGPGPVKINLGAGLTRAPGWTNVDASLNAFLSMGRAPARIINTAYRMSGARRFCSLEDYRSTLQNQRFVHHQVVFGLPFDDATVDYVYSSHFLEHVYRDEAARILEETFRVLRPGGTLRITVPDLAHAVALYSEGRKEEALQFFFPTSRDGELSRHRFLYDYELLAGLFEAVGFREIRRCEYRQGETPDLDSLDNRPEQTLYVEGKR